MAKTSKFLSVLATFSLYLTLSCSAYTRSSSSQTFASNQMNFWSQNVENKMPNPILKKLSPLTQKDTNFFANAISKNNEFSADDHFCTLSFLSCKLASGSVRCKSGYEMYNDKKVELSSHKTKEKVDPFAFFRLSLLKKGNTVHLPDLQESLPNRAFLPPQIASKISIRSMNDIAKTFPQSAGNEESKKAIETTLSHCNSEAIKGETKSCPTSLEEMISFTKLALGGKKLISLSSESTKFSNAEVIIKNIKKFQSDKIVTCHEVFLPFAAYFCHSLPSTNIYRVDFVEPKTGAPANSLLAMCHMDTSPWPANHVAFEILRSEPGKGEACHWLSQLDLAWINADGMSE